MKMELRKQRLVVVGNGMAAARALEELHERAPGRYEITVFGAEPHPTYNRIMLSPVLAGETQFAQIVTHDRDWYESRGMALRTGEAVTGIDRTTRTVSTALGAVEPFDKILLATGSNPFIVPVPGKDLPGVVSFRDLADVERMLVTCAKPGARAVVIGGGLLGLEAANGLLARGATVSVIHLMGTLMERQLDESAAMLLQRELERRGIAVLTAANTEAILGTDKVEGVQLKDGRVIPADLVVMAVGIRPNTDLGRAAGLTVERGVVVDDQMRTSDPDIYSIGECVQHRGLTYGLVAPLFEMAKICAEHLAGQAEVAYVPPAISTKLKVTGIAVFSAGQFSGGEGCEDIVFRDAARGVYKRLVLKDDKLVGAVLYGDAGDGSWFFSLMREGKPVADLRDTLIFGPNAGGGGASQDPNQAVAALPPEAEICGCNGVCKGKIVDTIKAKSLTTLEEVRAHTKASASCGSCTGLVEKVLACTLGDAYQASSAIKPMCGCTDHGHDEVRKLIRNKELRTIPEVMQALHWKTPDGCSKCRPALNYYLLCEWPGEYKDDQQSRFINERVHANIQKDGTYSVVPRMWGGLTNAKELRALADVVDQYQIPTVKVTGGQRIDLLGVKKEDLPGVWSALNKAGMVSGHAYGKALRTVKTCVGSEWCRFGTQDSTGLGVKIEQETWGSWMPHKFKIAVSGCPRNCAESTIKDFGVICVDSGYELHIAGNGGMKLRATDFLCKVSTEAEVMEYCGAFIQLYRQEARYLDRTAPWVERVGLDFVKQRIVDDHEGRKALYGKFLHSQKFAQIDPWAERAEGHVDKHEFTPMAQVS